MTEFDPHNPPAEFFISDEQGMPIGHVNVDRLQSDAVLLMYELAETAGDDEATDRVSERWVARTDPQYFGYLSSAALSLLTRCILGPTLDACDAAGLRLRDGLKAASAAAHRDLGGER